MLCLEISQRCYSICKWANRPNILPVEGVTPKLSDSCTVSKWTAYGSMPGYIEKCPGVNRLELVGLMHWQSDFPLTGLVGVTRGLGYLHDNEVVYGDLETVRRVYLTGE